jgi:hypothetical protein
LALAGVAIVAGVPMTLNAIKFGSPFDTGYVRMYEDRGVRASDFIGRRARECFFGPRWIPEHAWAMNVSFPRPDIRGGTLYLDRAGVNGASIWLTSPLLIGVFVACRRWWTDPVRRALMLGTAAVVLGLWCYHTTASYDTPYYRYSLDFIPIWLLVIAPYTTARRAVPWTVGCLAYSLLYYCSLPSMQAMAGR